MTSVGRYDLEIQIGAGTSGTVWRAHRRGPVGQTVALKRLRAAASTPTDLERLRREATVLAELDHPHVVRVLEVLEDGEGLAIAMQYAPGGSLQALLAQRGRLAPGEVVAVAAPVADALASAHRRGVIHGDVKPANILFTSDGEPLLGDFGVARTLGQLTGDVITGTAHYLAPEVVDGAIPDPRADTYALAVLCYEALTGQPPYRGPVPLAVLRAADAGVHEPLTRHPDVPRPLAEVVEQAMARDPAHRFETAERLARALRSSVPQASIQLPGTAGAVGPAAGTAAGTDGDAAGGTRTFGPRPPRPEPQPPRARYHLPAAFFVLVALAGALYLIRGPLRPGGECPQVERPVTDPGDQVVSGDPEGDGCVTYGVYRQQVLADGTPLMLLTIRVDGDELRIGLGTPGDQLFIGDWDCDGDDTPGVYRRTEGQVWYFDSWPEVPDQLRRPDRTEPAPPGATASAVAGEAAGKAAGEGDTGDRGAGTGSCDRITVA